jgi:hypothetical protein
LARRSAGIFAAFDQARLDQLVDRAHQRRPFDAQRLGQHALAHLAVHAPEHHDRVRQRLRNADVRHRLVGRRAVTALQHRQRRAEPHQRLFARVQGGVGIDHGSCLIVSLLSIVRVSTDPCRSENASARLQAEGAEKREGGRKV